MAHHRCTRSLRVLAPLLGAATIITGCATARRDLKPWTLADGTVVYELTGYCNDHNRCKEEAIDECGPNIFLSGPSENASGKWLFQCLQGTPRSTQACNCDL